MEALILFGSFIILLLLSVPIGYAIGISAMIGILTFPSIPMSAVASYCIVGTDSFPLMAIPLFVLAGNLMTNGGIAKRLLDVANSILGYIHGGLAIVTTVACMFFAAVSGSAVATTTAMGTFMIPAMVEKGYDKPFAGSVCAAAGSIGVIIPPSIPFVLFGCVAQVSIADLFIAGIIPGVLMGVVLSITSYIYCRIKGYSGSGVKPNLKDIFKTGIKAFWAILMPVIILGGIYSGAITPTESAVIAVVYCIVIGFFVYRELKLKDLLEAMKSTIGIGCVALYLMGFSQVFGTYLSLAQIPVKLTAFITASDLTPFMLFFVINIFLLIIGCFIDNIPATIILTPILMPMVTAMGMHPIQFGVLLTLNLTIGYCTPPYGINLFMAAMVGNIQIGSMMKSMVWFILALLVVLALTTYVPWVTLGLLGYV